MWIFIVISSILFVVFPEIDLYVSSLFYTPQEHFYLSNGTFERFFYYSVKPFLIGFYTLATLLWAYNRFFKRSVLNFTGRQLIYLFLVLGIGSGLIVNELFKKHWGRARPAEVVNFGGSEIFTPAFVISSQNGNSFSCGHGSGAFVLIAVALLFRRYKKVAMGVALSYGALVSLARIVDGGHFFSDVMVSFFVMWIVSKMLYYVMFEHENTINESRIVKK